MSRTKGHVDVPVYVQVEPEWGHRFAGDEEAPLRSAKFARATKTRPDRPVPGTVLMKLTLRIPAGAFYPLRPEAIVIVPESLTDATPIEVFAEHPGEEQESAP